MANLGLLSAARRSPYPTVVIASLYGGDSSRIYGAMRIRVGLRPNLWPPERRAGRAVVSQITLQAGGL